VGGKILFAFFHRKVSDASRFFSADVLEPAGMWLLCNDSSAFPSDVTSEWQLKIGSTSIPAKLTIRPRPGKSHHMKSF